MPWRSRWRPAPWRCQAQEVVRDTAARLALAETRVGEVALQRSQLEELMQSLSRSRDENLVVDIEAAVRLALQQAQVTGNVQPLLAALKAGDLRIARRRAPRLAPLQRAMQHDADRAAQQRQRRQRRSAAEARRTDAHGRRPAGAQCRGGARRRARHLAGRAAAGQCTLVAALPDDGAHRGPLAAAGGAHRAARGGAADARTDFLPAREPQASSCSTPAGAAVAAGRHGARRDGDRRRRRSTATSIRPRAGSRPRPRWCSRCRRRSAPASRHGSTRPLAALATAAAGR